MTRVLGIASGKGGVGKTTVTVNLALALSKFGKKVIAVDCNLSTPHLTYFLGAYKYTTTINDVLQGRADITNALYHHNDVMFVPASLAMEDLIAIDIIDIKYHIDKLVNPDMIDFILLDSAPGLGREAIGVFNACNEILYVTTPHYPNIRDVVRCADVAREFGKKQVGVVLNMTNGNHEFSAKDVETIVRLPVVGNVPFDKNVIHGLASRKPVVKFRPYCDASVGFMKLAARLSGEEYFEPRTRKLLGVYDRLRAAFFPSRFRLSDLNEESLH